MITFMFICLSVWISQSNTEVYLLEYSNPRQKQSASSYMNPELIFYCCQEGLVIYISKCSCSATNVPLCVILMRGHGIGPLCCICLYCNKNSLRFSFYTCNSIRRDSSKNHTPRSEWLRDTGFWSFRPSKLTLKYVVMFASVDNSQTHL